METTLRDLTHLILKVGLFPNASVLEATALFLELHLLLTLRVVQGGYPSYLRIPEYILATGRRQFFSSNSTKVDQQWYPFGDHLGDHSAFSVWAAKLQAGDIIDAAKYCKHENRAIWSRARVLEASVVKVAVQFVGEHAKIYHHRTLATTPYAIQPEGSRSVDWEWREKLGAGQLVDVYYGRKGWLLLEVKEVETKQNEETGEANRIAWCQLSSEADASDLCSSDEEISQFGRLPRSNIRRHHQCARPLP